MIDVKFDPNQDYQVQAINSVVQLFAGQESSDGYTDTDGSPIQLEGTLEFDQTVFGNSLALTADTLQTNIRRVQDTPVMRSGAICASVPESDRIEFKAGEFPTEFSVEMETGTGKTYVYIRTIAELYQKYGWSKFVVVVPSVAIREGVMSQLQQLRPHIAAIYDGLTYTPYLYNSARLGGVRSFATSTGLQIMVINIDAFATAKTIMNRPVEAMGYSKPIDFVRACRPVLILDEPQNLETQPRQEALSSLDPLVTVGYSATHRTLKHLIYRLTPVDAYDLGLVKRIGVLSVTRDEDFNEAYVEVVKIHTSTHAVTATAKIHKTGKSGSGTKPKQVTLKKDSDLVELSGGRGVYQGWSVEDIHASVNGRDGYVEFANGRHVKEGSNTVEETGQQQRVMIRQAVESHFEKEIQLLLQFRRGLIPAAIKPLTLIFIDRVAHYHPSDSKFRTWFEEEYESLRNDARFRALDMPDVKQVHDGYFATTSKGEPKDTAPGRDTADVESAFERIMRNRERLLSFDEKLRFIFSHSALVEGWDNPNVFTICSLQDGRSTLRKRQQIGRGLRLPVMENGERCRSEDVNVLTVIANERFAKFAADLQQEIQNETGVIFSDRIINLNTDRIHIKLNKKALASSAFEDLWKRISPKTTYTLNLDTDAIIDDAVNRINALPSIEPVMYRIAKTRVALSDEGVRGAGTTDRVSVVVQGAQKIPNIVGELSRRLPISRATVVRILERIHDLQQARLNPSIFMDNIEAAISSAVFANAAKSTEYVLLTDERWNAALFEELHQSHTVVKADMVVPVTKSVVDKIICDSKVEVEFARYLEDRDDVPIFLKLPGWFLISTPLGNYNPDWALVRRTETGETVYMVRETKGSSVIEDLQWESEGWKIRFGQAHFVAINIDYCFHRDPEVLITPRCGAT